MTKRNTILKNNNKCYLQKFCISGMANKCVKQQCTTELSAVMEMFRKCTVFMVAATRGYGALEMWPV